MQNKLSLTDGAIKRLVVDYLKPYAPMMVAVVASIILHIVMGNAYLPSLLKLYNDTFKQTPSYIQTQLVLKKTPPKKVAAKQIPKPQPDTSQKMIKNPIKTAKKSEVKRSPVIKKSYTTFIPVEIITAKRDALQDQTELVVPVDTVLDGTANAASAQNQVPGEVNTLAAESINHDADFVAPKFEDEPLPAPYHSIESHFDVYIAGESEQSRGVVGESVITFLADKQAYQLKSIIKPSGLAALFIPTLLQTSVGEMAENGLVPRHYLYQFGDQENKKYIAQFDWAQQKVLLHSAKGDSEVALPVGAQDLLSFMYQFMFVPPLNNMALSVTNGKRMSHYQYSFEGEEVIKTKMGNIKTLHIMRTDSDRDDKTELWLAVDYRYIPFKIRKVEQKKGKTYELVAREIKTDEGVMVGSDLASTEESNALPSNDSSAAKNTQAEPTQLNPFLNR